MLFEIRYSFGDRRVKFQLFLLSLFSFQIVASEFKLFVSNDGPTTLDTNVTFFAKLKGAVPGERYNYIFEDPFGHVASLFAGPNVSHSMRYKSNDDDTDESYLPGNYIMKVVAKAKMPFLPIYEEVARGKTKFVLTDTLNGNLSFSGFNGSDIVAVNTTLNVTYNIHDPSGFFKSADMDYAWSINDQRTYGLDNFVSFNVTKEGPVAINLVAHARVPIVIKNQTDSINKWGFANKQLKALRPVGNITISGNVFLKQGDILYLDITCDGTQPFTYCSRIIPPDLALKNITCDPVTYSQCSFHIQHYFPRAGKYAIGAIIGNRLGTKQYPMFIEIYDVSKKAQLSTVIVPIACSLLAMLIIIVGLAYHVHQRTAYVIEVADFDFQQPLPLSEKTFMERVKESFKVAYTSNCKEENKTEVDHDDKLINCNGDGGSGGGSRSLLLPKSYGAIA